MGIGHIKCPSCDSDILENSEICPNCGYRLKRKVSFILGLGILFFPMIFAWLTLRKGYSKLAKIISFSYLVFILILIIIGAQESKANKEYFKAHTNEIVKQVQTKYENGDYDDAIELITKYQSLENPNATLSKIKNSIEEHKREERAKKKEEEALRKKAEKEERAKKKEEDIIRETYAPGGLHKDWPINRQCYITILQDASGLKTIEKSTAISKNYIVDLYTTNKKVVAKTLWDGKTYKGTFEKVDTMEGFNDMMLGKSIFDRVYLSFLGGVQINIWIVEEEELRDDFSTYTRIVHYLQIWDTDNGKKMIFECP